MKPLKFGHGHSQRCSSAVNFPSQDRCLLTQRHFNPYLPSLLHCSSLLCCTCFKLVCCGVCVCDCCSVPHSCVRFSLHCSSLHAVPCVTLSRFPLLVRFVCSIVLSLLPVKLYDIVVIPGYVSCDIGRLCCDSCVCCVSMLPVFPCAHVWCYQRLWGHDPGQCRMSNDHLCSNCDSVLKITAAASHMPTYMQ